MKNINFLRKIVAVVVLTMSSLSMANGYIPSRDRMVQKIDQWIALLDWYKGTEPGNPKLMLEVGDVHYKKVKALVSRAPKFDDSTHELLWELIDSNGEQPCENLVEDYYLLSIQDDIRRSIHDSFIDVRFFGEEAAVIKQKFAYAKAIVEQLSCENAELMKKKYQAVFSKN